MRFFLIKLAEQKTEEFSDEEKTMIRMAFRIMEGHQIQTIEKIEQNPKYQ